MDAMKIQLVSSLIANLSRAIVRTVGRISGKAAQQISRSSSTSPIGDPETTGALCPDDKGGSENKGLWWPSAESATFGLLAMTTANGQSEN